MHRPLPPVLQACLAHRHHHGKSLLLSTAALGMALSPGKPQNFLNLLRATSIAGNKQTPNPSFWRKKKASFLS